MWKCKKASKNVAGKERRAFGPSKAMYKQMKMKPGYEVLYRDKIILTIFFDMESLKRILSRGMAMPKIGSES